ncbi:hypothetical protein ScalyP_jg8742 [Parmales sp. scaly parma]|nr:hypothetical protein ScalyP_jg8742 [Parmales sp. scaly parma]
MSTSSTPTPPTPSTPPAPTPTPTPISDTFTPIIPPDLSLGVATLGIDHGTVRCGIAITKSGGIASPEPLTILSSVAASAVASTTFLPSSDSDSAPPPPPPPKKKKPKKPKYDEENLCRQILQVVKRESAKQIVIGMPYRKNRNKDTGFENTQTTIVRRFGSSLAKCIALSGIAGLRVFYWDERFSSKAVKAARMGSGAAAPKDNDFLDAESAGMILDHFYKTAGKAKFGEILEEVYVPYGEHVEEMEMEKEMEVDKNKRRPTRAQLRQQMMGK